MSEISDLNCDGVLRPSSALSGTHEALLPSRTVQCHAANLMPLANGDLACVWFAGTQEGMSDISIHISRLRKGSDRWTEAERLDDDAARSEQNPILFPMPDGRLMLLYTSQRAGNQDTAIVRYRTSVDLGETWSPAATLIGEAGTFVRQPIHVRSDGAWVLPVFECRTRPGERWSGSYDTSAIKVSHDAGRSWSHHPVPDSIGAVHMNVLDVGNGEMLALYRSRFADWIQSSRSHDGGLCWSAPVSTTLPNNNSSIQATVLADGRVALVYNASSAVNATSRRDNLYDEIEDDTPSSGQSTPSVQPEAPARTAFWGAPRAPLCLVLSRDRGQTWGLPLQLDTSDGYCLTNNSRDRLNRELSYPSIKQASDGRVHVAYTYFRRAIKHLQLDRV